MIQVEATDRNGNSAFKSIFWDGTGGVIAEDFPIIDFNLLSPPSVTIKGGEESRYHVRVENAGGSTAHVDFWLSLNGTDREHRIEQEHLNIVWEDMSYDHGHPTHIDLDSGQTVETYVDIITTASTPNGTYDVEASLEYLALGAPQTRSVDLEVVVDGVIKPQENETDDEVDVEDSPMPGLVVITSVVLFAAAVVHRRRRRQ